mmetsp:Transcript_20181/g.32685  ORF Transcript_20181/g.32685 Transcript_20181/m.32685 type:complete len:228 (-) Transcript_20181:209-892(-)
METPSTPAAVALIALVPACASSPDTATSKLPQSSTPNSSCSIGMSFTFEPAIANAIPATSGPSEGNTEVMAGTPSIWSPAVRGTWSVSGIVMSLSRKNFCASYATLSATITSQMGSQSLRMAACGSPASGAWRTDSTYSRYWSRSISRTMRSYALPCLDTTSRMAAANFLRAASFACLLTSGAFLPAFLASAFSSLPFLERPHTMGTGAAPAREAARDASVERDTDS